MTNIFSKAIAASVILAGAGMANAELVTYDFDSFAPGTSVTDQIDGVTIGLLGAPAGEGPRAMRISDTSYEPAGGMALRPSTFATGLSQGPWFDLVFEFDEPTDYFSILALDAEEPVSARAYLGQTLVDLIGFRSGTNYQVWNLELGEVGGSREFDRVVVDIVTTGQGWLPGPEIFDNLQFSRSAVPTPGAMTLLATGGILAMRRRRIEG